MHPNLVYNLDLLVATVGPTAAREFDQSTENCKADLWVWLTETLPTLPDTQFVAAASYAIHDSANVGRFRGNFEAVHCKASACYGESQRRHTVSHPDEDCNASSLYDRAYNMTVRDAGHSQMASDLRPCTCATGTGARALAPAAD